MHRKHCLGILIIRGPLDLYFDTKTSSASQPIGKIWPVICHRGLKIANFCPKKVPKNMFLIIK